MNKSYIYRLIGILGVIFMVASVFLPFINYAGYSTSLFDMTKNEYYVPYIILVFSALSLVTFIINKKIELNYLSIGSSFTLIVLYSIRYMNSFNSLSAGYYLLIISLIILFISILLQAVSKISKKDMKIIANEDSNNMNSIQSNNNFKPNELAQSIMDQPVMRNLSSIDDNSLKNVDGEDNTLSPQNPLNQFITQSSNSNIDLQKNREINNRDNLQSDLINKKSDLSNQNNNDANNQLDESQSILSIMSQPMVGNSMVSGSSIDNSSSENKFNSPISELSNSSDIINQYNHNENQSSQQLMSEISNIQPMSQVSEPQIAQIPEIQPMSQVSESQTVQISEIQPMSQVSEPQTVQIPEIQPMSQVSEPQTVQIPEIQPMSQVSEPQTVQIPEIQPMSQVSEPQTVQIPEIQPMNQVSEPQTVQIPENEPMSQVSEPQTVQIPENKPMSQVSESQTVQIPENKPMSQVSESQLDSDSIFGQNPIRFD